MAGALRFAAGLSRLRGALADVMPRTPKEWLWRLGPEAGYAVLGAAMAPEGVTMPERFGLGAEDALLGLGTSFLGSTAGRGVFGMRYPAERFPRDGARWQRLKEKRLGEYTGLGDLLAGPLLMVVPRPYADSVYERIFAEQNQREQQEAMAQMEQRQQLAALIPTISGAGLLADL